MSHVVFIHYASPKGHEEFQRVVNEQLKYQYQGKIRHGTHRPLLSEVRMYDIRIKKELIPQLMRDLNIGDATQKQSVWYSGNFAVTVGRILRFVRRCLGLKTVAPLVGESPVQFVTWHYSQLVGVIPDLEENGEEIL